MHCVLVVDDEPRQRRILSNIIREYRKEYEVLEAKNGEEAVALCKERKIDIIFSDIRMPKMDGLEMMERIREVNPHSRIVVISGYSDFHYAQKALDYRVSKYILKPIESHVIWDAMMQVEEDILRIRNSETYKSKMAEKLNLLLPIYRDHLMSKWIKGGCTNDEMTEVERVLGFHGRGYIVLSRIANHASHKDALLAADKTKAIRLLVKQRVGEVLQPYGHLVSFIWQYDEDCIVSLMACTDDNKSEQDKLASALKTLADTMHRDHGIDLSMGTGTIEDNLFANVQQAFHTADVALRCHFYRHHADVIFHADIKQLYQEKWKMTFPFEDQLRSHIHGHETLRADELEKGLQQMFRHHYPDPELLLDYIRNMMLRLHQSIHAIISEEADGRILRSIHHVFQLDVCTNLSQLRKHWFERLTEMADEVQKQKDNKNTIVMERCLQYIHEHYGEDLALDELAQKFYFNPSYFSTLFKKYTGKHFTSYLTDLRLGIARKKLLESDQKVYEVVQEVGYRDVKYFNKLFKKHFGLTPNECRTFATGRTMAK